MLSKRIIIPKRNITKNNETNIHWVFPDVKKSSTKKSTWELDRPREIQENFAPKMLKRFRNGGQPGQKPINKNQTPGFLVNSVGKSNNMAVAYPAKKNTHSPSNDYNGWETTFILGRPIFRCELLVLGKVLLGMGQ